MAYVDAVTAIYSNCFGGNGFNYSDGMDYGFCKQLTVEINLFVILSAVWKILFNNNQRPQNGMCCGWLAAKKER